MNTKFIMGCATSGVLWEVLKCKKSMGLRSLYFMGAQTILFSIISLQQQLEINKTYVYHFFITSYTYTRDCYILHSSLLMREFLWLLQSNCDTL